jgi:acetyltransferase-like isoleucine patch superfamily enzyme
VFFGSGAVVRPRVSIAEGVVVGAGAVVIKDVETSCVVVGGVPAKPIGNINKKLTGVPEPPRE